MISLNNSLLYILWRKNDFAMSIWLFFQWSIFRSSRTFMSRQKYNSEFWILMPKLICIFMYLSNHFSACSLLSTKKLLVLPEFHDCVYRLEIHKIWCVLSCIGQSTNSTFSENLPVLVVDVIFWFPHNLCVICILDD